MTVASEIVSNVLGWTYFFVWSVSFYPQILLNWRRRSVEGLSFDFLLLNATGYFAYSVFTVVLKVSEPVQRQYAYLNDGSKTIPVDWSDCVFALHGFVITLITISQAFFYPSGLQLPSRPAVALASFLWISMGASFLLAGTGALWTMQFLYYLSFVKLVVTITKYVPQLVLNYRRKSTEGWSIWQILLDFTGGVLSFGQQGVDALGAHDVAVFTGNPVKLALSLVSVTFDVAFILQHYVFFSSRRRGRGAEILHEDV